MKYYIVLTESDISGYYQHILLEKYIYDKVDDYARAEEIVAEFEDNRSNDETYSRNLEICSEEEMKRLHRRLHRGEYLENGIWYDNENNVILVEDREI